MKIIKWMIVSLLIVLVAAQCSPAATPTPITIEKTVEVEKEVIVKETQVVEVLVTLTPEPLVTSDPATGNPLYDMLPDDIKKSGEIEVVTNPASGPPWTYHPGDDVNVYDGIAIDMAEAVAKRLGVSIEWTDATSISAIIPTLLADRYNLAAGGYFDTKEREEVIDQIVYAKDAATIVVAKGNPKQIKGLDDLCGKTVAVPVGTNQEKIVQEQQANCSEPIDIQTFPAKTETFLQVQSGRADATIDGYAVSLYLYSNNAVGYEGLEPLLDVVLNPAGVTFCISKNQTLLRDAVVQAFNDMIADGEYMQILQKWNIPASAVDEVLVNPLSSGQ